MDPIPGFTQDKLPMRMVGLFAGLHELPFEGLKQPDALLLVSADPTILGQSQVPGSPSLLGSFNGNQHHGWWVRLNRPDLLEANLRLDARGKNSELAVH